MGFTLIERYIFRKAALAVLIAAGAVISVLWVMRAVQEVDVVLSKGQGILTYLQITSLGVPTLAAAVIPIALLIGLVQTINTLNNDSELVVLHASGASRLVLLRPFIALSMLVSAIVFVLHVWAAPTSMQSLRKFVTQVRADLVSVVVQEGQFRPVGEGVVFHVASRAPGGILKGVLIHDNREKNKTFTYLAEEGVVAEVDDRAYLVLQKGHIHNRNNSDDSLSVIKFDSYSFNLSELAAGPAEQSYSQLEVDTVELIYPDKNGWLYKNWPGRITAELHTRLTGWLYPIMIGLAVLAFLGNPSSHRQSQSLTVFAACALILAARGFTVYCEAAARTNPAMIYLMWGVPLSNIVIWSTLLATDKSAVPADWLAKSEAVLNRIGEAISMLRSRLGYNELAPGTTR